MMAQKKKRIGMSISRKDPRKRKKVVYRNINAMIASIIRHYESNWRVVDCIEENTSPSYNLYEPQYTVQYIK